MEELRPAFYDEVYAADGPRAHTVALARALERLGPDRLAATGRQRDAIVLQQGIAFDAGDLRDRLRRAEEELSSSEEGTEARRAAERDHRRYEAFLKMAEAGR